VAQPIRITGPVHGVDIRLAWSREPERDRHGIMDCRLALTLVPLVRWLAGQGVDTVEFVSSLRGPSSGPRRPRSLHNVGLAMDMVALRVGERRISVKDAYPKGRLRDCSNSRMRSEDAALWTGLVCAAVNGNRVHTLLTPDYDHAHRDHLHLDLKPEQRAGSTPYVSLAGS
jgi:hypothetical protein